MIQDIENFKPDLGIEGLGNFSDVIVLEQRRIEVYQAGPSQDVAPYVAPEIRASARYAWVKRVRGFRHVMRNKAYGHALGGQRNRSCREREALGIDVVVRSEERRVGKEC